MDPRMILFLACAYFADAQVIPLTSTEIRSLEGGHNLIRMSQDATAMQKIRWNPQLATYAEKVASRCASHSSNAERAGLAGFRNVGENIYMSSRKPTNFAREVVFYWATEMNNYSLASNTCRGVCGHYTQVVWASTTDVGCGMANCPNNPNFPILLVCNYGPAGNMNNQRPFSKDGPAGSQCSSQYPGEKAAPDGLCVK